MNPSQPETAPLYAEPEAEAQLIARLMYGFAGKPLEPPALAPSRFTVESHRLIFTAIRDLHHKGQPYDVVSVMSMLKQRGQLTAQRRNYLTGLTAEVGTQDSLRHYVSLIKQAAAARAFGPIGRAISELALRAPDVPVETIKARYQSLVRRADAICDVASRNGRSPTLRVWTPHEILATPAPSLNWVYEPWLGVGDIVLMAGESGLGKSWMALDLMFALSLAMDWAGVKSSSGPMRVFYVDEENNFRLVRHRISRLVDGMDLSASQLDPANLWACYAMEQGVNLDDPASLDLLKRKLDQLRPGFIIFDSLIRIHRRDENSNSEMAELIGGVIKPLARNVGAGAIIIHHLGKSTKDRPEGRIAERMRGASDLRAVADQIWGIEKMEDALMMTHIKCRFDRESGPLTVSLDDVHNDSGVTLSYEPRDMDSIESVAEALDLAGQTGMARQTIVNMLAEGGVKVPEKAASRALGMLNKAARVVKHREGQTVRYWLARHAPATV